MREYRFKFSVIMAVYKVEEFIREAVDSVISQSIGFENIQLILVDDGSPDGSPAICDEYAEKYPDNIVVIHKENGGASSARNAGLDIAEGCLVNFLDSDDKFTVETLENVWKFYGEHKDETDIVVIPMYFFDGCSGKHTLNYKFSEGSRVIDLCKEWNVCQMQSGATFIKAECVQALRFDTRLSYSEDANFLQRILAQKCTMGVMNKGRYMYRKRSSGEQSAIQASHSKPEWYVNNLKYFHLSIIDFYKEKFGFVPRFIQYVLMYDLQWRIKMEKIQPGVLTETEKTEFLELVAEIIRNVDDEVILAQKNIYIEHKIFALKEKYGSTKILPLQNDIGYVFGNNIAARLSSCQCRMEFLKIDGDTCTISGRITFMPEFNKDIGVYLAESDKEYACNISKTEVIKSSLGTPILCAVGFEGTIPLTESCSRVFVLLSISGKIVRLGNLYSGTFFPVTNRLYKTAAATIQNRLVTMERDHLCIRNVTPQEAKHQRLMFLRELWTRNKKGERKAVIARTLAHFMRLFKKKPLWLISDRIMKAGDNGEAFFIYMRKNHPEIDCRFVIGKDCADYQALRKIGPVIVKDSFKHKLLVLFCDYICSSQGDSDVFNPFIGYSEPYRDLLCRQKFIFLQHGVTYNDLSGWLDRYNKDIRGFATSSRAEYDAIIHGKYHYTEKQIWLTGMPRYDRLYHAEERQITIMPTWRKYLLGDCNRYSKSWSLGPSFLNSEYLHFYNQLINDSRLLEAADRYGYKIAFFPHPNLQDHLDCFEKNEKVEILGFNTEYRDIYAKSNLVVTDYSSAVFDFAYLRKPLIYTQFDKDEFYSGGHTVDRGYFDFERDGFGEVEYTLDDTVNRIIEYMANDCRLKDKYRERIDKFFAFNDKNNCQRVYDRIMELDASEQ